MSNGPSTFVCPFPDCNRPHADKSQLKSHLRSAKADDADQRHTDPAIWAQAENDGLLTVRLRKLPETERLERRKESRARTYATHKGDNLRKQKAVRMRRQQILKALFDSIHEHRELIDQLRQTARGNMRMEKLRGAVVGRAWKRAPSVSHFVFQTEHLSESADQITIETFPRFVVYFLRPSQLPSFAGNRPIVNLLPSKKHYHTISLSIHPDKDPDPASLEMMMFLTASFNDHWDPRIRDPEMKKVMLWNDGYQEEFRSRGEKFELIADMYEAYIEACDAATPYQDPDKDLSVKDVWTLGAQSDWKGVLDLCSLFDSFPDAEDVLGKTRRVGAKNSQNVESEVESEGGD